MEKGLRKRRPVVHSDPSLGDVPNPGITEYFSTNPGNDEYTSPNRDHLIKTLWNRFKMEFLFLIVLLLVVKDATSSYCKTETDISVFNSSFVENELKFAATIHKLESRIKFLESELELRIEMLESNFGIHMLAEEEEKKKLKDESAMDMESRLKKLEDMAARVNDLDQDLMLQEIRVMVDKQIEQHAADGIGRPDYALHSAGARVVKHSEPFAFDFIENPEDVHENANNLLTPSFGEVGRGFCLNGSVGFVEIELAREIIPESVTVDCVAKSVAYGSGLRTAAPKDFKVTAWLVGESGRLEKIYTLANFTYSLDKKNVQTFAVEDLPSSSLGVVNMVRFEVLSNQGNSGGTCMSRLRVHGHEPDIGWESTT